MIVEVLDLARREFDEAFVYYESQRPGLGEEFRSAVKRQIEKIKAHPDAWMPVSPGVRKCLGRQFPYDVVYQQTDAGLLILALAHKKRIPSYWAKRICKR
jgi:plasmid stabilization system protein ParE